MHTDALKPFLMVAECTTKRAIDALQVDRIRTRNPRFKP